MNDGLLDRIRWLQNATVGALRGEWERLYGEPTRSRNRVYLWKRLAFRIQEIEHGGLSDGAKARLAELAPSGCVRIRVPNDVLSASELTNPTRLTACRRDRRLPSPGSTLVRRYKGQDVRVTVKDDGFECDGRRFDSLSEVAFAVTGSRWNGWLFFNLTKRARGR